MNQQPEQLNELALFAGAGGGILGGHLLGWRTVCAVEFAAYPRSVLLARQRDGMLPKFPVWDDVRTFDGKPWRGSVDVISGGFPCQDISVAGKGDGLDGERSGLWSEMARIIGEVQPRFAFVENSPMLTSRGLGTVLGDLAALGYNAEWGVLGARDAGIPQRRDRIWILAHAPRCGTSYLLPDDAIDVTGHPSRIYATRRLVSHAYNQDTRARSVSILGDAYRSALLDGGGKRGIDGLADRLVREKAIGNGQVPIVAALAWNTLYSRIQQRS